MKMMKRNRIWLLLLIAGWFLIPSCEKGSKPEEEAVPRETRIINNWIWDGMNDIYLWEEYIPDMDPDIQPDPEEFFYKLLYKDDRDSWITDDYDALIDMFEGVELTTGMSARPGVINGNQVISIIEYVTPNSPAADSGIKRGDIIYAIDGRTLDRNNYYSLYNQTKATFEFATWNGYDVVPDGRSISLTAIQLNQNPVVYREVIQHEGKKVGYFVYTQFTDGKDGEWLDELKGVFEEFISAGVTDVVMDLRYNPGGSLDISAYIASTLGPFSAMNDNKTYVELVWNDFYNSFWKEYDLDKDGNPDGKDSPQLVIKLPQSDLNMNLSRVYFLTTDVTASASESLITGLFPYADVVHIGDTTYGKCFGSVTIDDYKEPKRHNWAMQPIVLKYSNAEGFTDFREGLMPDVPIEENLLYAEPFGSLKDPFLAAALGEITGVPVAGKKISELRTRFKALPVPQKAMVERIIEWPEDQPVGNRY